MALQLPLRRALRGSKTVGVLGRPPQLTAPASERLSARDGRPDKDRTFQFALRSARSSDLPAPGPSHAPARFRHRREAHASFAFVVK